MTQYGTVLLTDAREGMQVTFRIQALALAKEPLDVRRDFRKHNEKLPFVDRM